MSVIIILPQNGTDINKYINIWESTFTIKFEIKFEQNLRDILMDLGMFNAFSIEDADFTELKKEKNNYIGKVIYKT